MLDACNWEGPVFGSTCDEAHVARGQPLPVTALTVLQLSCRVAVPFAIVYVVLLCETTLTGACVVCHVPHVSLSLQTRAYIILYSYVNMYKIAIREKRR